MLSIPMKKLKRKESKQAKSSQQAVLDRISLTRFPTNTVEDYRFYKAHELYAKKPIPANSLNHVETAIFMKKIKRLHQAESLACYFNGVIQVNFSTIDYLQVTTRTSKLRHLSAIKCLLSTVRNQSDSVLGLNSLIAKNSLCIISQKNNLPERVVLLYINATEEGLLHSIRNSSTAATILGKKHASLTITEEFVALRGGRLLTSSSLAVQMSSFTDVSHTFIQLEAPFEDNFSFKSTHVQQKKSSNYTHNQISMGAGRTRHDVFANQLGPDTVTNFDHFAIAKGSHSNDLTSKIRLDYPRGIVNQRYRLILGTHGNGVFDGNVKINLPASKSSALQLSRVLLLGQNLKANVKPNLQINADEVKCCHGCSVCGINKRETFYLGSRGVSKEMAQEELGLSFATVNINDIDNASLDRLTQEGLCLSVVMKENFV